MTRIALSLVPVSIPLVAAGAVFLLPTKPEYAELLYRDGAISQAHNVMAEVQSNNPASAEVGFRLARIQAHMGDVDAAIATLTDLVEGGNRDPLIVMALADLKKSLGDMDGYINLLLQLPVENLSQATRSELMGWLTFTRRNADELRSLKRLEVAGLATSTQLRRLGMLLIAQGALQSGVTRLERLDDLGVLDDSQARLTLIAAHLELGQQDNAHVRARGWKSEASDTTLDQNITQLFEAWGAVIETE